MMNASMQRIDVPISDAEAALRVLPLGKAQDQWNEFIESNPGATLYHRQAWTEALRRAYGFRILAAIVKRSGTITAGCLLAPSKIPFVKRVVGLPFSDSCAPVGCDDDAVNMLLQNLARGREMPGNVEIHGIEAPSPWQTVDCFQNWSLDLARPFAEVQRTADRNFRRQVRRAIEDGFRIESGSSMEMLVRFYRLQLETRRRLGVPPQPLRFFKLVREEFVRTGGFEVWLASQNGLDRAAVVVLRDRATIYAKWSARAAYGADGASHLVFHSMLESYAGTATSLDLGRADIRNMGLSRFKSEMGGKPSRLPYSYFPRLRHTLSAESPDHAAGMMAALWRRLPLWITRAIGRTAYGFLA
jgi:Acetyltransferase (GNAT) domain